MKVTGQHIISLKEVSVGYSVTEPLLESVHANVDQGELVALIGKNGSGKSTLLRSIAALQEVLDGELEIDRRKNTRIPKGKLSRLLSFVEAGNTVLENLSVFELVSIGRHPYTNWWGSLSTDDNEKIMEAIGFVGMTDFCTVAINRLSDGERQRVMIARALAQETPLMLMDEPTAFLDLPNKFEIINLLYTLRQEGKSIVYSTHDLETAFLFADKCWVINEGQLIEGSFEDLGLQDIFKTLFKDTRVLFDEQQMKFVPERSSRAKVSLDIKDNRLYAWTSKCVERCGLEIGGSREGVVISVKKQGADFIWSVSDKDSLAEFYSLYELARYLQRI